MDVFECEVCGMSYTNSESDIQQHKKVHEKFEKLQEIYPFILKSSENEKSKQKAFYNLKPNDSFKDSQRFWAEKLVQSYFSRSLLACPINHIDFSSYFAMILDGQRTEAPLNLFNEELFDELVRIYGKKTSQLKPGFYFQAA